MGRCPGCGGWNTFLEKDKILPESRSEELSQVSLKGYTRYTSSSRELDRVLGGGIVPGSVILLSGDPGIGKSTLLLQLSSSVAKRGKVVYASGEESVHQVKLRAQRMDISGENLYLLSETNLEAIVREMERISPLLGVVDSIQTVHTSEIEGSPGSMAQIRECTLELMHWAKDQGISLFISGHVTKEGNIAGPKILEHIVDVVLQLEGEHLSNYRILRGVKNRFGSTNEIGVFEMGEKGLTEVENPSLLFLSQGQGIGSTIAVILEGSRPLLVEVQALTSPTSFSLPRRIVSGIDLNRLLLIIAVLSKQGLQLYNQDVIANAVGGIRVGEPASDLGVALAITSSHKGRRVKPGMVVVGEIGLSGELRPVSQISRRISEAQRLGFTHCLIPKASDNNFSSPPGMTILAVSTIREALSCGFE